MISILEDQEKAKQSLISLKSQHTDISSKTSQKQAQIELLTSDFSVRVVLTRPHGPQCAGAKICRGF